MINYILLIICLLMAVSTFIMSYLYFKAESLSKEIIDIKNNMIKKDPYEDYRNDKGLLSMKHVKERYLK